MQLRTIKLSEKCMGYICISLNFHAQMSMKKCLINSELGHWKCKCKMWITVTECQPSGHLVPKWRCIDVDATWSRRIDVDTTSIFTSCVRWESRSFSQQESWTLLVYDQRLGIFIPSGHRNLKNMRTIVVLYRSPETLLPIIWALRPSWLSNHNLFS